MKKAIICILIFSLLCPLLNLPVYIYCNLLFYDGDTLSQDLQGNLKYYYDKEYSDVYFDYYGENIENLLVELLKINFVPVEKTETISTLAFRDIDKISRMSALPMNNNHDIDINLGNIQFFTIDGKNYMLCNYRNDSFCYKLYTYESKPELNTILSEDCFSPTGLFRSAKRITLRPPVYILFSDYIPVVVLILLLFLPFLVCKNRKLSEKSRKRITLAAKIGLFAIPVCAIFCSIYIYRYTTSAELLPSFFSVIKEILCR